MRQRSVPDTAAVKAMSATMESIKFAMMSSLQSCVQKLAECGGCAAGVRSFVESCGGDRTPEDAARLHELS